LIVHGFEELTEKYLRVIDEINWCKAELNSWKAELNNIARIYQQFVDRNVALKKRENELKLNISELERKETRLNESLSEFQENNAYNDILNLEVKQDAIISTDDVLIPQPVVPINSDQNENETLHYLSKVEPSSSRTLIFDTKDLF
jgi:DNA repair exonuclease SbcCD ATPase subunit